MKKRRKYKENPYILENDGTTYWIKFKDSKNIINRISISKEVYDAFDRFELDDLKELNEYDRHIEHLKLLENTLEKRAVNKSINTDKIVEDRIFNEKLKYAISNLPEIQKRRLKLYYFDNKTLEEIALLEKCSKVAVKYSIDIALEKISKKIDY